MTRKADSGLLGIYLNDHLAGSTGGVGLARRLARARRGADSAPALQRIATEIAEDRVALREIMEALEVPARRYKAAGAWIGEKLGRLKLNGRLLRRSPLSDVLELEALMLGVRGKAAGWQTLRAVAEHDHRLDRTRLDELLARAERQADTLADLRMRAAAEVLAAPPG